MSQGINSKCPEVEMSNLFTKQNKNILSDIPFTQAEDWLSLDDTRVINDDSGFSNLWREVCF